MANRNKARKRGIWCLETVWFDSTSNVSIRPMLELLNSLYGTPFVHRNAVTREEFLFFLDAWADAGNKEEQFPILILSYHGHQGTLCLKDAETVDWDDPDGWDESIVTLEEISERLEGRCTDRVVHFSSCSGLDVTHNDISNFVNVTNASAVSGYAKNVDWVQAMAFELLYLKEIQDAPHVRLTPKIMWEINETLQVETQAIEEFLDGDLGILPLAEMARGLGFNLRARAEPARV